MKKVQYRICRMVWAIFTLTPMVLMSYAIATDVSSGPLQTDAQKLQQEKAALRQKISKSWKNYQEDPKRHFYSQKNDTSEQRAYVERYIDRPIATIVKHRYPSQLEQFRGLRLIVDMQINVDGSLRKARVLRTSGSISFDELVLAGIQQAAPFKSFEGQGFEDTKILHVTRSMGFSPQ